jgi:hypothetical protein
MGISSRKFLRKSSPRSKALLGKMKAGKFGKKTVSRSSVRVGSPRLRVSGSKYKAPGIKGVRGRGAGMRSRNRGMMNNMMKQLRGGNTARTAQVRKQRRKAGGGGQLSLF